jgi:hypothetical protein
MAALWRLGSETVSGRAVVRRRVGLTEDGGLRWALDPDPIGLGMPEYCEIVTRRTVGHGADLCPAVVSDDEGSRQANGPADC